MNEIIFENSWGNQTRAESYAKLEFPNTYFLAYRDLPEIILNEWASFTTKDFPGNKTAQTGDIVLDIMLDVEDRRPVEDIFWTVDDYIKLFDLTGLELEATYKPLGFDHEPFEWVSEKEIAPWMIFVTKKK
jgi:hypothetical protein